MSTVKLPLTDTRVAVGHRPRLARHAPDVNGQIFVGANDAPRDGDCRDTVGTYRRRHADAFQNAALGVVYRHTSRWMPA